MTKRSWSSTLLGSLGLGGPVTHGAVSTFVVKGLGVPSTLLLQFVLVRLLSPTGYGEFMYAYVWYATLVPFAALGVHETAVRFVAECRQRHDASTLHGFLRWSALIAVCGGLVVALVAAASTLAVRGRLTPTLLVTLLIAWACLPLGGVAQLGAATLRALGRFALAQAPLQVGQPLLIVATTSALIVVVESAPTAVTATWAMFVAVGVASASIGWLAVRQIRMLFPVTARPRYQFQMWAETAVHFIGLILVGALWRVDVLMLGALASTTAAGIYATALQLQLVAGFFYYTLEVVIAPTIAQLYAAGEREKLQRILRLASRTSACSALVGVIVLVGFGRELLALFDPAFVAGYGALLFLAGGQLYDVLTGCSGRLLTMTGHHRAAMWTMAGAMAVNVTLNALLIPSHGMQGAAVATAIALLTWKTASLLYARRVLGIDTSVLASKGVSSPSAGP